MLTCGGCDYREAINHHEPNLCLCKHPETLVQRDVFLKDELGGGIWYNPRNEPAKEDDECRHGYQDIWAAKGAARLIEIANNDAAELTFKIQTKIWEGV